MSLSAESLALLGGTPSGTSFEWTPPNSRGPVAPSWELCPDCGVEAEPAGPEETRCPQCSQLFDSPEDERAGLAIEAIKAGPPLVVVGPGAGPYQRALDSASTSNPTDAHRASLLRELCTYNTAHVNKAGMDFPEDLLRATVFLYDEVRRKSVCRATEKLSILAALLWRACIEAGVDRSEAEIARFFQLEHAGLSRGRCGLARRDLPAEPPAGQIADAALATALQALGFETDTRRAPGSARPVRFPASGGGAAALARTRAAALALMERGQELNVGRTFHIKTQIVASLFVVLCRLDRPAVWAEWDGRLGWVASEAKIRKNTLQQYVSMLDAYHSKFVPVYKKFGLDALKRKLGK